MKFFVTVIMLFTMNSALAQDLHGSWRLKRFVQVAEDGSQSSYCHSPRGMIVYDSRASMSVAINCDDRSKDVFYAGRYRTSGEAVWHQILYSSSPTLIGKIQIRKYQILGNTLTLIGSFNGGSVRVVWSRI